MTPEAIGTIIGTIVAAGSAAWAVIKATAAQKNGKATEKKANKNSLALSSIQSDYDRLNELYDELKSERTDDLKKILQLEAGSIEERKRHELEVLDLKTTIKRLEYQLATINDQYKAVLLLNEEYIAEIDRLKTKASKPSRSGSGGTGNLPVENVTTPQTGNGSSSGSATGN